MKRIIVPLFCAVLLATGTAFAERTSGQRFYGKIVSIDSGHHNFVVHNAKQKVDAGFQWNESTAITQNKKQANAGDLKVGQSLIVSYVADADVNRATKISVRTPFKRASAQD